MPIKKLSRITKTLSICQFDSDEGFPGAFERTVDVLASALIDKTVDVLAGVLIERTVDMLAGVLKVYVGVGALSKYVFAVLTDSAC